MGAAALAVGTNGGVQKGLTRRREGLGRMEEMVVEVVMGVIGGNEGKEEGSGIGELVATEEGLKEGEEGREGEGERREVGMSPVEEREEGSRMGGE